MIYFESDSPNFMILAIEIEKCFEIDTYDVYLYIHRSEQRTTRIIILKFHNFNFLFFCFADKTSSP